MKEKLYKMDLADHFQDVDSILVITFQIAIHDQRKHAKALGVDLPTSKHHSKAKQSQLHQGDGTQGVSTVEIMEKKQGKLEERRKRRDEMVQTLLLFYCLY